VAAVILNGTAVECITPSVSFNRTVQLDLTFDGVDKSTDLIFTYVNQAVLTDILPNYGSTYGGTELIIRGLGFYANNVLLCNFGYIGSYNAIFISDTELICITPSYYIGGPVLITLSGILSSYICTYICVYIYVCNICINTYICIHVSLHLEICIYMIYSYRLYLHILGDVMNPLGPTEFTYVKPPRVSSLPSITIPDKLRFPYVPTIFTIVPKYGSTEGGTIVVISGILFEGYKTAVCLFGNVSVPALVVNDTTIECLTPSSDPLNVNISVILDEYEITPANLFSFINMTYVENISADYSENIAINIIARVPSVDQIYPMKMSADGGDILNIYGTNFDIEFSKFSCHFGVYGSIDAYVLSDSLLECRVPKGNKGVITFILHELKNSDLFSVDIEYYDQLVILDAYARQSDPLVTVRVMSDMGAYSVHGGGLNCVLNDNLIKGLIINENLICINDMILLNNTMISIIDDSGMFISNAVPINIILDLNSTNTQKYEVYGVNDGDVCYTDNLYSQVRDSKIYSSKPPLSVMAIFNTGKSLTPFMIQNLAVTTSYNDMNYLGEVMEENEHKYTPTIIDAVCKINGTTYYSTNSFYNLDKQFFNSLTSPPVGTTPDTPKVDRKPHLIIDTVTPLILDIKNNTWITITGKTFTNNTMCYLKSSLHVITYYISPYMLKCSIPTMAVIKVWSVNLTLLEKFGDIAIRSINSYLLYYRDLNLVNSLRLKIPETATAVTSATGEKHVFKYIYIYSYTYECVYLYIY
jgi:hypothetical protein